MDPITIAALGMSILSPISFVGSIAMLAVGVNDKITFTLGAPTTILDNGGTLSSGCGAADPYIDLINQAAAQYNIEPAWIAAVLDQESNGKADAKNQESGATGLMQTLPGTFQETRTNPVAPNPKDPVVTVTAAKNRAGKALPNSMTDPEAAIYSGTHYLRSISNNFFPGNLKLILAGYNAGPGTVLDAGKQVPSIKETQDYVQNITTVLIPKYQKCLNKESSLAGQGVSSDIGEVSVAAARVIEFAKANPATVCQRTNNTGSRSCAKTVAKTFEGAFNAGNGKDGTDIGQREVRPRTDPPTPKDLATAKQILAEGDLPAWHINGEFSGQHWIIILKVDDNNQIYYLDPALTGGGIQSGGVTNKPFNARSKVDDAGDVAFFGFTAQGPQDYLRGYRFPASKYIR